MVEKVNPYKLSPEEHEQIYQEIKAEALDSSKAQQEPVAIITGGQPGSGKSGITGRAIQELEGAGGYVLVDADELRAKHPGYVPALKENDREAANLTHPDAGAWAGRLNRDAIEARRNVIIDQTSKDPEALAALTAKLKEAGYRTELRVMAVNERVSEQRIYTRYESQKAANGVGRFSTKENHDIAYAGMARTVAAAEDRKLVDAISVYDKDHRQLHRGELDAGQWKPQAGAAAAIAQERSRPMQPAETKEIVDQYKLLSEQIATPKRNATPAEKQVIADLSAKAVKYDRASTLRFEPAEQGAKKYPELAGSYAAVAAIEAKARQDKLPAPAVVQVVARTRDNVAAELERGGSPKINVREARQIEADQDRSR